MEEKDESLENRAIYYPPGGILIWIVMILEIFTFIGATLVFMYYRNVSWEEFQLFRNHVNPIVGTINTIVLISSGYFIANSIYYLRDNDQIKSAKNMLWGLLLGVVFLIIKGGEYYFKLDAGFGMGYNTFFALYWMMTGFHFMHVLFGVGLLAYMYVAVKNKKYGDDNLLDVETSGTYWHMCDLIWILIFPILYLI